MKDIDIASVLRAMGGEDPDMPVVSEEQKELDYENAIKFNEKIKNMVETISEEKDL